MMLIALKIVIVLAYLSLILELTVFHVPSVASSLNIFNPRPDILATYSERFRRIFQMSNWKKVIFFILPLILIYFTYFFPVFIFFKNTPIPLGQLYQPNPIIYGVGIGLIIWGRYTTFSSVLTIRKENTQKENSFALHTDQGFSKSRNPGLMGLYLFLFGIWIGIPSIYFLMGIVVYISYMHFKVLMEEDFLQNKYGNNYSHYFQKTNRYF